MASILIRGGRLLSPADKLDAKLDLRIENGVITEIGPKLTSKLKGSADTILDARGQVRRARLRGHSHPPERAGW